LADRRLQSKLLRPREHDPAHDRSLIHDALQIRQQLRRALHLIEDHAA